jgi:hypothetical protein
MLIRPHKHGNSSQFIPLCSTTTHSIMLCARGMSLRNYFS